MGLFTFLGAFSVLIPTVSLALTQGRLGLENTSYFNEAANSSGLTSFSLLQADILSYRQDGRYVGWGNHSGLAYIADTNEPLLKVNELYLNSTESVDSRWQVSAGRRLYQWSQMDEDWRLGLWQPRFMWDYLNPELQGLTGFFFRWAGSRWEFIMMATPVFIPEQGAPLRQDRGRIVSSSRWISQPANRVSLLDQDANLNYYLSVPRNSDIINNPAAAATLRAGDRSDGYWAQFSYGYKPMNQLLLGAEPSIRVSGRKIGQSSDTPGDTAANVRIHPRVVYHQISEITAGFSRQDRYSAWLSALTEQPIMDQVPGSWISQQVAPMFLISPGASYTFKAKGPTPTRLKTSIIRQWGGDAQDTGELATPGRSKFQPRYPFRNAAQLEFLTPLWWSKSQVISGLGRVIYEWEDQGIVLSGRIMYRPWRQLDLILGADLLGQWAEEDNSVASFGARYRSNDRVYAGVQYVF